MRTLLLVVGILVAFGMIGAGVYIATEAARKKQASDNAHETIETSPSAPNPIDVSTTELEGAYKANEVRADAQYKGKLLRVAGTVDRISRDILDDPHVILKSSDYLGGVTCSFGKGGDAQVIDLDRGQRVALVGVGAGYAFGGPMLARCRVERAMGPVCRVPNADNKGVTVVGECVSTSGCAGVYYKGACDGPADIVCCVR